MPKNFTLTFSNCDRDSRRPETGPAAHADDWTGVFIRGDDSFMYAEAIDKALSYGGGYDMITRKILEGLRDVLASSNEGKKNAQ